MSSVLQQKKELKNTSHEFESLPLRQRLQKKSASGAFFYLDGGCKVEQPVSLSLVVTSHTKIRKDTICIFLLYTLTLPDVLYWISFCLKDGT